MPLSQAKLNPKRRPQHGSLVARMLADAWRDSAPAPDVSEAQLADVTRLLYTSGSAALGWWRIRNSNLAASDAGKQLHDAYRRSRLNALVHESEIKHILSLLREVDIEPVLVKGWAVARLYPDQALRPYGDIDLCVRPDQFARAESALKCLENLDGHYVDLHDGFSKLDGARPPSDEHKQFRVQALACRRWDELFERSQLVDIGDDEIRVLSDEDHLRVLCLHLLRSGAWRPLWFCDVAVVLGVRKPDFDWTRCLGRDAKQAAWVTSVIGLAHQLLGVDIDKIPVAESARRLPQWLVPAVLRQWDRCRNPHAAGSVVPTLLAAITQPTKIVSDVYARWDNPVRSTAALRGRFNDWPRWPYQLCDLILHCPEVPRQLRVVLRDRWQRRASSPTVSEGFAAERA